MDTATASVTNGVNATEDSTLIDMTYHNRSVTLNFKNLKYIAKNRKGKIVKPILDDISGTFYPGRLTAILGPSGAGKTSLLNVLLRNKTQGVTGQITINTSNAINFQKMCIFIPQEFAMLGKLTCLETLHIAANFKLNSNLTHIMKTKIVNNVIDILKLYSCLNTYVCRMSGGEKKRLSIATELLRNPPVMLFDEPTSGLDSMSAVQVISHLKNLAKAGRTIVCVIHQPSSQIMEFFDDMYVLSEGQCVYRGPVADLVSTFQKSGFQCPEYYNRADFSLEVASAKQPGNLDTLIEKFKNADVNTEMYVASKTDASDYATEDFCNKKYSVSFLKQFYLLTKRNWLCMMRDSFFVHIRLLTHILIGLLIGSVFYDIGNSASKVQSNFSCLFFFLLFIYFANAMPTVLSFPLDAKVFLREHRNNYYSVEAYYFSKIISELPLQVFGPTLFILIGYYMTGQPLEWPRFLMIWVICVLMGVIAEFMGLVSGAICNMQLGTFIIPCISIPMLLFSGFFINLKDLQPFYQPFTKISYFRYGFEGSMQAIYGYNRTRLNCMEQYCHYLRPNKLLVDLGMDGSRFEDDVTGLVVWVFALQVMLYVALHVKLCMSR